MFLDGFMCILTEKIMMVLNIDRNIDNVFCCVRNSGFLKTNRPQRPPAFSIFFIIFSIFYFGCILRDLVRSLVWCVCACLCFLRQPCVAHIRYILRSTRSREGCTHILDEKLSRFLFFVAVLRLWPRKGESKKAELHREHATKRWCIRSRVYNRLFPAFFHKQLTVQWRSIASSRRAVSSSYWGIQIYLYCHKLLRVPGFLSFSCNRKISKTKSGDFFWGVHHFLLP